MRHGESHAEKVSVAQERAKWRRYSVLDSLVVKILEHGSRGAGSTPAQVFLDNLPAQSELLFPELLAHAAEGVHPARPLARFAQRSKPEITGGAARSSPITPLHHQNLYV